MWWRRTGLWLNSEFIKLWSAQTISQLGSRITREGLPLAAILILGASPVEVGFLTAASAAPLVLIGLFAGVWVDRLPRRRIMVVTDLARAVILLSVPLAYGVGRLSIELLYVVAGLMGALTVFFDLADQAFLPSVVKREHLVEGNSKLGASASLAEIGGPALAGVLIQVLTAPIAMLLDALSFVVSALFVGWMRTPDHVGEASIAQPNVWREIREGLQIVFSQPVLRTLALTASVSTFFGYFFWPLYAIYGVRDLGLSPAVLGILVSMGGIGALGGTFVAEWAARRFGVGPAIVGSRLLASGVGLLTPLAGGPVALIFVMMAIPQLVGDGALMVYMINQTSLRQTLVPDRLLGRANASVQLLVGGLGPVGTILGGVMGTVIGVRATLLIAVVGMLVVSIVLALSPVRHIREQPALAEG